MLLQKSKAQATITPLGSVPGYTTFIPTHISSDGTKILGYANHTDNQETEALLWSLHSGWTELGSLPNDVNWRHSHPTGLSANGRVAVGNSYFSRSYTGFMWRVDSGITAVELPSWAAEANLSGISGDSHVATGSMFDAARYVRVPFFWTASNPFTALPMARGYYSGITEGINFDGSIIIGTCSGDSGSGGVRREAVYWTSNGEVVGLGDLPGGAFWSEAHSVSADGSVIVGEATPATIVEAFRWSANTGMVSLGVLLGSRSSSATFVTADGQKILGYCYGATGGQPFVWNQVHGMRTLRDFLVEDYNMGGVIAGWRLDSAIALSADNRAMIGMGSDPLGNSTAWVIRFTPPPFILSGRITLQAAVDQAQPLSFRFTPQDGTPAFTLVATLNSDRTFSLSGLPAKEYDVHIKGRKWLTKKISVDMRGGDVTGINVTLRGGDANDDDSGDILDLLLLIAHYNQTREDVGYLEAADFNCDEACDIIDLLLLVGNYNRIGDA